MEDDVGERIEWNGMEWNGESTLATTGENDDTDGDPANTLFDHCKYVAVGSLLWTIMLFPQSLFNICYRAIMFYCYV